MNLCLDSSALAKRYIAEPGSERVEARLAEAQSLAVSVLCYPEIVSAFQRRRREGSLTKTQAALAKAALETDLADVSILQLTHDVVLHAVTLMARHPLRASDALHVACAVAWQADLFLSSDARQCTAARAAGLKVEQI